MFVYIVSSENDESMWKEFFKIENVINSTFSM